MASITSAQLNYLVFRYLQESGFVHSAFALGYEAGINKCTIDGNMVPPSALVTLVQRGLQYLEMEANLNNSDTDVEEDFSFLEPLDLITKDVHELRKIIRDKKRSLQKEKDKDKEAEKDHEAEQRRLREKDRHEKEKEHEKDRDKKEKDKEPQRQREDNMGKIVVVEDRNHLKQEENGPSVVPQQMDTSTVSTSQPCEIPPTDVMILEGHTSEVCACAWSPTGSVLASGSGDSTARIWSIPESTSKSIQSGPLSVLVLKHVKGRTNEKSKDVTTLDWNGDGTLLATGSYDGQARIWSTNGELRTTLSKHKGPIFSLKWNKKGDYLLTGSCDKLPLCGMLRPRKEDSNLNFIQVQHST
ncbi:hypothetical protein MLD38_005088 [Melastoma candidum]|uniref:Uncharacterized protein n=1 Tax=Melastoma candidum TaxID=119954 RepID=A0ACB9SCL6_9MYRT|nr:hypothetical protein MLD38_005088 [Melastoma candidum]